MERLEKWLSINGYIKQCDCQ